MEKIYINLPYSLKEQGKQIGCMYDMEKKSWYIMDKKLIPEFKMVEIEVPFELKDIAKENGCKFNWETRYWETCAFNKVNIEKILENKDIRKLVEIEDELKKKPTTKAINNIEKISSLYNKYGISDKSDKMTFPR